MERSRWYGPRDATAAQVGEWDGWFERLTFWNPWGLWGFRPGVWGWADACRAGSGVMPTGRGFVYPAVPAILNPAVAG